MKRAKTKSGEGEARKWLEAATRWRLLGLMFQLPTPGVRREIRRLAQNLASPLGELAAEWARAPLDAATAEYHRVLGPGGVPAVESSYDPNALAGRGPLLADIAGFHEAFAYRPEEQPAAVPDHIAAECDFLAYLAMKAAHAEYEGRSGEALITREAFGQFEREHLFTWLAKFRERLEGAGANFYVHALRCIEAPEPPAGRKDAVVLSVLALLLGMFMCGTAAAQPQTSGASAAGEKQSAAQPAARSPAQPPAQAKPIRIGDAVLSGSLRARMENWWWFQAPAGEDRYTFGGFNLRVALEQKKERFEWRLEGMFPFLAGLPTRAVLPAPQGQLGLGGSYFAASGRQDGSATFRHGYVRFKKIFGDTASSLRLGRFEAAEGAEVTPPDATLAVLKRDRIAQRLLGSFGFSHVGRGFDGLEYVRQSGPGNLTLLAARPTEGVFRLRSLRQLDVDFYYGAFTRQFSAKQRAGEWRAFVLHYHDGRGALKVDNRPQAARAADRRNIRLTTLGGHAMAVFGAGAHKTDLLFWGAAQFGRWGSLDHRAGAFAAETGHQFPGKWKPWLRGGIFVSSGDGNAADDAHTTFFQLLPTPRIYARFPFYNLMNNQDFFVELRLRPAAKLLLRADARHIRLTSSRDLWYAGGGAFEQQTFGFAGRPANLQHSLGGVFDLSLDYDVNSRTRISFYGGGVRGGAVQAGIYPAGGVRPPGGFVFVEVLQRF